MIESKLEVFSKFTCPLCNEWQNIDELLRNAPSMQQDLNSQIAAIRKEIGEVHGITSRILSQIDKSFSDLFQLFVDEAKEGPRLFSLYPVDPCFFDKSDWISHKFRLVLWREHSPCSTARTASWVCMSWISPANE